MAFEAYRSAHHHHHHHHRGPLVVIAVGIGFGLVGAIPVAVNSALGETNSGTIIGVGFIGFGLLLIVPGLLWCVVQRLVVLKRFCECCRCSISRRDSTKNLEEEDEEGTPALIAKQSRCSAVDTSFSIIHHEYMKEEFNEEETTPTTADNEDTGRPEPSR